MTVLSIFEIRVTPDALQEAPQLISETLAGTRSQPGCIGVEVTVDIYDPSRFFLVERWATLADDDAYRAWRMTPEGAPTVGRILAGPPVLTRTEVHDEL
ncbi:putative quinol monooxygenase [Microbacterium sp. HMH0099]|uniref:putative quinol monooxygenase n=1 Tax=Microbacterium sp. HMH0099 TaxID=3414026 RepID=UPI003BF7270B